MFLRIGRVCVVVLALATSGSLLAEPPGPTTFSIVAADPENARAYYELGRSYLSAGDTDKAKEALQQFLSMAPNDPEAPSAKEMLSYLE